MSTNNVPLNMLSNQDQINEIVNTYRSSTSETDQYRTPSEQEQIQEITNPLKNTFLSETTLDTMNREYRKIINHYINHFTLLQNTINLIYPTNDGNTTLIPRYNPRTFIKSGISHSMKEERSIPENATLKSMIFEHPGTEQQYKRYYLKIKEAKDKFFSNKNLPYLKEYLMNNTKLSNATLYKSYSSPNETNCINSASYEHQVNPHNVVGWTFDKHNKYCNIYSTLGTIDKNQKGFISGTIRGLIDKQNNTIPLRIKQEDTEINVLKSWIPPNSPTNMSRPFQINGNEGTKINDELRNQIRLLLQIHYALITNHRHLLESNELSQESTKNEFEVTPGRVLRLIAFLRMLRNYNYQIQSYLVSFSSKQYFGKNMETTPVEQFENFTETPLRDRIQENLNSIENINHSVKKSKLKTQEIYQKNQITLEQLTASQTMATTQLVGFLVSVGFLVLVSVVPSATS
jgi:hypothetical protein